MISPASDDSPSSSTSDTEMSDPGEKDIQNAMDQYLNSNLLT